MACVLGTQEPRKKLGAGCVAMEKLAIHTAQIYSCQGLDQVHHHGSNQGHQG